MILSNELLDAAIARVEARNPVVNAVVTPLHDLARQAIAAGLPDGPFRGVPYLLKDLGAPMAGTRVTRGSRFFADTPPAARDGELDDGCGQPGGQPDAGDPEIGRVLVVVLHAHRRRRAA